MAKKAKKKAAPARKPRPAPRGMYLTIDLDARGMSHKTVRINSFLDITRIGHDVARAVREYLRAVPMYPHVRAWSLSVWPRWTQTSLAPKKDKAHDDAQRASDLEAQEEF